MKSMKTCIVCKKISVRVLLNFRKQPVCHNYLGSANKQKAEYLHNLIVGQCGVCGIIQLVDRFPIKHITPLHQWMVKYTEPERHLDELASTIIRLPGIRKTSKICGISFKDDTLLARLNNLGFTSSTRLNQKDLGIAQSIYGPETVQHYFTFSTAKKIKIEQGAQDVVVVRHLFEHAYDPMEFITSCKELLAPGGYLLIEVPGVDKALRSYDYTTVWEEHTLYFTRKTFKWIFSYLSLSLRYFKEIEYPLENSLVSISQIGKKENKKYLYNRILKQQLNLGRRFASVFESKKKKIHEFFIMHGRCILFGAGHLGCIWVNIFNIQKFIDIFIDDDAHKSQLYMPGSTIPIVQLKDFEKKQISMCLLSSNPDKHPTILKKHKRFFQNIDIVASIFPQVNAQIASVYTLRLHPLK